MAVISKDDPDAADEERWVRYGSAPLMATLLLPIIIGVILVFKCVFNQCCARKTNTGKDEMYGLEGRMTMLPTTDLVQLSSSSNNPPVVASQANHRPKSSPVGPGKRESIDAKDIIENNFHSEKGPLINGNDAGVESSPSSSVFNNGDRALAMEYRRSSGGSRLTSSQDSNDLAGSLKRASAQHRQLPDLPQTPGGLTASHPPRRSSSVLSHDGTSELYATVGETPLPEGTSKRNSHYAQIRENPISSPKASTSAAAGSGLPPGPSLSGLSRVKGVEATPSSDSETYASTSLKDHPYAKLKKQEHPYDRVRPSVNNDEETDTDNYDLPQFPSRQSVPGSSQGGGGPSRPSTIQNSGPPGETDGPVPPRRVGRQWRQPPVANADNASHFSGDSQDSRGYTSISVREPLSNLRNQVGTVAGASYDSQSHYATLSDDSEEMYAAIDDPSYTHIGDDNNRRPWLGGPNVSSPIPERREANSPLPPVPNVPPPELSPQGGSVPPPPSSPPTTPSAGPPVYAQVTKKKKTPVTPTASNASTSSQQIREPPLGSENPLPPPPPKDSTSLYSSSTHHRSKRAASLMDNSNPMDADTVDSRRWSKADISYSEFDVVRETIFPSCNGTPVVEEPPNLLRSPGSGRSDTSPGTSQRQDLVDEDNYNIIPEKSSRQGMDRDSARIRLDSGNYHEIEPRNNTYQEIGGLKEPSDHYQEIGDRLRRCEEDDDGGDLYQVIDKKEDDEDDDEDEEEDQFYERVKKPGKGKKHGYEKIKKKNPVGNLSRVKPALGSDDEDDDDDDKPDQLYESVKYPPYERLKESKDDLHDGSDSYEDIGYSRVKPKKPQPKGSPEPERSRPVSGVSIGSATLPNRPVQDVSQLYAQVDKTKKRTKNKPNQQNTSVTAQDNSGSFQAVQVQDISGNNNEPSFSTMPLYSKVNKAAKTNKNNATPGQHGENEAGDNPINNDNSIEYI